MKDITVFKKIIVISVAIFLFPSIHLAQANLLINEIMYAPASGSEHEWVEIFNNGNDPVDLENYRFFHGETNSGPFTLRNGSTTLLQPLTYAIIAKSLPDYAWLGFPGMILSASTLSLPDSGDNTYIAISDQNKIILDHVTYDTSLGGNKDSGNSLQKISDIWVGATPTPGVANEAAETSPPSPTPPPVVPPSGGGGASSGSSSSVGTTKPKVIEEQKIKTQIFSKNIGVVGIPVSLEGKVYGHQGEKLYSGKVFWNFGDGDSKETQLNYNIPFTHVYFYPGEYTVSFYYYQNYYSDIPDASSQINIKVIPASVTISRVGDEKDFFVELSNDTDYGIDISSWMLASNAKSFTIPKNTILASKKKMIISPRITNFSILDKNNLKLMTPQNEIVFNYAVATEKPSYSRKISKSNTTTVNTVATAKLSDILPANAVASELAQDKNSANSFPIFPVISAIFIGASAYGVYFIRRRKATANEGDNFDILDE